MPRALVRRIRGAFSIAPGPQPVRVVVMLAVVSVAAWAVAVTVGAARRAAGAVGRGWLHVRRAPGVRPRRRAAAAKH